MLYVYFCVCSGKPARRPVTSGTINVGEGLSENGDGGLEKDKFHPGRAGFSGTKLQVQHRSMQSVSVVLYNILVSYLTHHPSFIYFQATQHSQLYLQKNQN